MPVNLVSGNIFESEAECITDANNSIGISGAGLALAFAKRYPAVAKDYNWFSGEWQKHHQVRDPEGGYRLMPPVIYPKGHLDNKDYAVCKFPTMILPGDITKESHIVTNLELLSELLPLKRIKSIALPALGCGIGRYPFQKLEEQVRRVFDESGIDVHLYQPAG